MDEVGARYALATPFAGIFYKENLDGLRAVAALVKQCPETTVLLSHFYASEIAVLTGAVNAHPAAYVDLGCCKPEVGWWGEAVRQMEPSRLMMGTGAPLYYHASWLSLHA